MEPELKSVESEIDSGDLLQENISYQVNHTKVMTLVFIFVLIICK